MRAEVCFLVEDLLVVYSMRELVLIAALVSALNGASLPPASEVEYKCQEDQDNNVTRVAEQFINDHHRHGYKFKFVSLDSRTAEGKVSVCGIFAWFLLNQVLMVEIGTSNVFTNMVLYVCAGGCL